jgi:hypothetical protein
MNRFTKAFAVAAAFMALPSLASAIGITIVSSTVAEGSLLGTGDTVTFDLRMGLDDPAGNLYGLGVTVDGYDDPDVLAVRQGGLTFQSATVVSDAFGIDLGSGPQFGISNNEAPGGSENYVLNQLNPQAYTTSLFQGIATSPAAGTGADDVGIGGGLVTGGDVHFQVTFVASQLPGAPVTSTMSFNVLAVRAGGATETTSETFAITVVPEPGTALLMGLGLAGLAANRRR